MTGYVADLSWNSGARAIEKLDRLRSTMAVNVLKKWSLWMWSLARREQFSFWVKSWSSQQTWNRLRALKLCAVYRQSRMEFLTIVGTTALMAWSLGHTWQRQSRHLQNLAPWPKTAFDIAQILFATFYFIFLRGEILELQQRQNTWGPADIWM